MNAGNGFLGPESAATTSGNFFEALTSSHLYKNTKVLLRTFITSLSFVRSHFVLPFYFFLKNSENAYELFGIQVRDISGSFRWAPFLALQTSNSFLTMLLLLSKYKLKSLPVVDLGEGKIDNIITQSAVIHMLAECAGLQWFESWGTKKLSELGLPVMTPGRVIKVHFSSQFMLVDAKFVTYVLGA